MVPATPPAILHLNDLAGVVSGLREECSGRGHIPPHLYGGVHTP